jgi:hypothetical protein
MRTTVVNYRTEVFDQYIMRPSKWGNPFITGIHGTKLEVIEKHRLWLFTQPHLLTDLHELRGRRLGCVCSPGKCHGDILAQLADIPIGPAIWRCSESDMPVDITGIMGLGSDDRIYLRTVYGSGVPLDEVFFDFIEH